MSNKTINDKCTKIVDMLINARIDKDMSYESVDARLVPGTDWEYCKKSYTQYLENGMSPNVVMLGELYGYADAVDLDVEIVLKPKPRYNYRVETEKDVWHIQAWSMCEALKKLQDDIDVCNIVTVRRLY